MPFDASEFPRLPPPEPSPATPVWAPPGWASRREAWAAWLRGLLSPPPGRRGIRPPVPERPDAADITSLHLLQAARALIESQDAWGQGAYQTLGGRRCAIGALRAAATAARAEWRESGAKAEAHAHLLAVARGRGFASVELMNDGSSHAQVLAAFDAAAAKAARR